MTGYYIKKDKKKAKRVNEVNSPITYVTKNVVPTILFHGTKDKVVPITPGRPQTDLSRCDKSRCLRPRTFTQSPKGEAKPSKADEVLTQKIKLAASFLDMRVLDHLIITSEGYFSFFDEGLL